MKMTISHFAILYLDCKPLFRRFFVKGLIAFSYVLVCMGTVLAADASSPMLETTTDRIYVLGSGDKVRVSVFGHNDISGEFEISGDGTISIPLIQSVQAAGLTATKLEQLITEKLMPDFLKNPKVSVEVLNYRPFYILGEVKNPGSYSYVNGITVKQAVALAGGYTYRAKKSSISISRTDDTGENIIEADEDASVLPGDIIEVPERFF